MSDTKPPCKRWQANIEFPGVRVPQISRDKALVLCLGAWGTTCERPIDRPGASAYDEHCERHDNHEQVILEALPLLGTRPIHKEAVTPMDGDNGHEHLTE